MTAPYYIETFVTRAGKHRWRIRARNGQVIQSSSDDYANRASMMRTVRRVAESAGWPVKENP